MTNVLPVEEIQKELERGEKALRSAVILFQNDLLEDAISRAYYAVLHSAKAALLVEKVNADSHSAVRRLFGKHMVQGGKIDRRYGKILSEEQDDRYRADYDVIFAPERGLVESRIQGAEDFLQTIKSYIKNKGVVLS